MKLSLNVPALERLLGGDTELEIELRKQIAAQFVENHLGAFKKLVDEKFSLETTKAMDEIIRQEIHDKIGTRQQSQAGYRWTYTSNVKEQIKTVIDEAVSTAVGEAIKKHVEDRINYYKSDWIKVVDQAFKKYVDAEIQQRIKEGIDQRLKAAAELSV